MRFSRIKVTLIIAAACLISLHTGCAKAPDGKLATAKQALEAAKKAEADIYMAGGYQNMVNAIKTAESMMITEKEGFVLTRKYKRITEMLDKTIQYTNNLAKEAPNVKAKMSTQVKENLSIVDGLLKETANDIKKAGRKRRRREKALFKDLDATLEAADSVAAVAKTKFNAGDVKGTIADLDEVQALMKKITDTLNPKKEG